MKFVVLGYVIVSGKQWIHFNDTHAIHVYNVSTITLVCIFEPLPGSVTQRRFTDSTCLIIPFSNKIFVPLFKSISFQLILFDNYQRFIKKGLILNNLKFKIKVNFEVTTLSKNRRAAVSKKICQNFTSTVELL